MNAVELKKFLDLSGVDVELDLGPQIVQAFSKRYLKAIVHTDVMREEIQKIGSGVKAVAEEEIYSTKRSMVRGVRSLDPEIEAAIKAGVKKAIDSEVAISIERYWRNEVKPGLQEKIGEKFKKYADYFLTDGIRKQVVEQLKVVIDAMYPVKIGDVVLTKEKER
jgi:hypothetical protein